VSRDTPWHLIRVHLFLPTQQLEDRPRDGNLPQSMAICRSPRQSAAFCHILPSPPNSAKFCHDRCPNPILLRARINQATKLTIYTLSSRFLTFFPYATSWPYHIVYVRSLIISTPLYIIVTRTYSVTLGFLIKITSTAIGKELTLINPLLRFSSKYFYST